MNNYKIEQKILTLARYAVENKNGKSDSFEIDNVRFSQWKFDCAEKWSDEAEVWIASTNISDENWEKALDSFYKKMSKLIPKIAFVAQVYTEYLTES